MAYLYRICILHRTRHARVSATIDAIFATANTNGGSCINAANLDHVRFHRLRLNHPGFGRKAKRIRRGSLGSSGTAEGIPSICKN